MEKLNELIKWAIEELHLNPDEVNRHSKELLKACIEKNKLEFIEVFNNWDKELIDLYFDKTDKVLNLSLNGDLYKYFLLSLLKRGYYDEYLRRIRISDETEEMQELFFNGLDKVSFSTNYSMYFDEKERLKKTIIKGRIDLIINVYSNSYDEDIYKLLEGKMVDLDTAFNFYGRRVGDHFLENHNHILFKELLDNKRFKYLSFIQTEHIEKAMEEPDMYDYIINLLFSLPDTDEYNHFFVNSYIKNSPKFLKKIIERERVNYLELTSYWNKAWTKDNQKLYYEAKKRNPKFNPRYIKTNYESYIEAYLEESNNSIWYNRIKNIEDNSNLNNYCYVLQIANDLHNNEIQTDNMILKNYYDFIYQTKSSRIFCLINYLIDKDFNQLGLLFTESGLTEYFHEQLLYDQDYLKYCKENNKNVISDMNDVNTELLVRLLRDYPTITRCIIIMKDNLSDYISDGRPTEKFVKDLFNENGYKILLAMLDNKEDIDLTDIQVYILNKANELNNNRIKSAYFNYCNNYLENLTKENVDDLLKIIGRVINNNAFEISKKSNEFISEILNYSNPEEKLDEYEDIFDEDNIPEFAKRYIMYKMLFSKNLIRNNINSPVLRSMTDDEINKIVFFDLFKISLGSFNDDLMNYLAELTDGENLYKSIRQNKRPESDLSVDEIRILNRYRRKIDFISKYFYNFEVDKSKNDIESLDYFEKQLSDRTGIHVQFLPLMTLNIVVSDLFKDFGLSNMVLLKTYAHGQLITKTAFEEGRHNRNMNLKIEDGDFLKGVDSKFLDNILQYGSLCKEMLGEDADRDSTHMDTDMSIIRGENLTIPDILKLKIDANYWGDMKLVLSKKCMQSFDKCIITSFGQKFSQADKAKTEVFPMSGNSETTHYGIRTGFPSIYIKAIIADDYIDKIKFKIVRKGFYIPIYDSKGNLVFSYDEYWKLCNKKAGLKKYNQRKYMLSDNLESERITEICENLSNSENDATIKRKAIYEVLNEVFKKYFKGVKYRVDGSVTPGVVDIFDTGSTGRGTNVPNDSDFDFILRVDKSFKYGPHYNDFIGDVYKAFGRSGSDENIRLYDVKLPGIDSLLDIEISTIEKTNKVTYSTEECIKDRLSTIMGIYPDKYKLVVSNIVRAKEILKGANAYKPKHAGKNPQGGLGGVGVENWILQNGGSLYDAAKSFVETAEKCGNDLRLFQKKYPIYDFGENHLSQKINKYPYDDFVYNLDAEGFKRTIEALNNYILARDDEYREVAVLK